MKVSVSWLSQLHNAENILKLARKDRQWNPTWDQKVTDASGDWSRLTLSSNHPYSLARFMRVIRRTLLAQGIDIGGREVHEDSQLALHLAEEIDQLERKVAQATSLLKKTRNWLRDKRIAEVRRLLEKA